MARKQRWESPERGIKRSTGAKRGLLAAMTALPPLRRAPPQPANLRLRRPSRFRILRPCVSGNPPVAGDHHDWSRLGGIGTVTPAGGCILQLQAGGTEPSRVPYSRANQQLNHVNYSR